MYKLILKLAWKNSFLRRSRTLLVIIMIAVSMSMMLAIEGIYDGMVENMVDKNKRSDSGDISIFAKEYRINKDLAYMIKNADEIKAEIESMKGAQAVVLRVKAEGLLSTARKSSFASVVGIDLQEEERFGKFSEFLKEGTIDLQKQGAIVGLELAKTLKVGVGSKVVFSTQDIRGEINSIALYVRAIVQTTNISLDNSAIFIDINQLHKFLGTDSKNAMQIAIRGEDEELYGKLKIAFAELDVKSFLELQPMMKQMQDLMIIFNSVTFLIVMGVVFIGIFGVMYVSILDRVREFGIMISVGMHYKYITIQIFLESIVIGVLGYLSGAVLGAVLLTYLEHYGIDLSAFSDALSAWGYEAVIYATIKASYFTTTLGAIMAASMLSVIIPLAKIKRLNPIEVIKAEK
ncbi:MAG: FtsX-like permease family protein [Sulfurimonas sp.]|uniref:ABC transporter permease n=1 Tax=Sulfurimonas sp. TaxID=2022749 RepID=UPI0028CD2EA4|nr:FtsX-like permease family protein [Sulfurimonas sp.]MDT8337747.1 FtsX-like permease family protein [Sulfurimonas sp.]